MILQFVNIYCLMYNKILVMKRTVYGKEMFFLCKHDNVFTCIQCQAYHIYIYLSYQLKEKTHKTINSYKRLTGFPSRSWKILHAFVCVNMFTEDIHLTSIFFSK